MSAHMGTHSHIPRGYQFKLPDGVEWNRCLERGEEAVGGHMRWNQEKRRALRVVVFIQPA